MPVLSNTQLQRWQELVDARAAELKAFPLVLDSVGPDDVQGQLGHMQQQDGDEDEDSDQGELKGPTREELEEVEAMNCLYLPMETEGYFKQVC